MITHENTEIPTHIAFIMDGNGRWATKQGLSRSEGHKAGVVVMDDIISYAYKIGVKHITFYSFSTENWKRPAEEVAALMKILTKWLNIMLKRFREKDDEIYKNTRINFIGDIGVFSTLQKSKIDEIEAKSRLSDNKMILNIAINYGGRADIVQSVNKFIADNPKRKISEKDICNGLYTKNQPDPDLIIRTGGEMRLSNFLIWQASYSEYYSTGTLWPDFNHDSLDDAIYEYNKRIRKFGGLSDK